MATTKGLIQKVTISPDSFDPAFACIWIGPTPTNSELMSIARMQSDPDSVGAFKNSMIDTLVTAMVARREVVVGHETDNAIITDVGIDPV